MLYITKSELLDSQTHEILSSGNIVEISGRPLNVWTPEKEYAYNNSEEVIDMLFMPRLAVVTTIPEIGHRHIDPIFLGKYVTVTGICPENDYEYRFGVREELHFSVKAITSVVQAGLAQFFQDDSYQIEYDAAVSRCTPSR